MASERLRRFEAALAGVPPSRVAGVWHRFVAESHKGGADGDQGAFEYGGRYNPRREFGALYLSDSAAACAAEMRRRPGVRTRYWHARIRTVLRRALDLTDAAIRARLRLAEADLVSKDWSLTHDVARAARRAGFDALIVPSAAGRHHNLVVFKDLMSRGETVRMEGIEPASPPAP